MSGIDSTNNDVISVCSPLPRILKAEAREARLVHVRWQSGQERIVDLAPALESRRIYIPLRTDDALFQTLRVSEFGDSIEWSNGLDFSAVWLSKLPPAIFSNQDFVRAMDELGMSLEGMAAALDISRRLVADYRGTKPIPRHIAFATRYLIDRQDGANDNQGSPSEALLKA